MALENESVIVQKLPDKDALGNDQFMLRARVSVWATRQALSSLLRALDQFDWFLVVSQPNMTKDVVKLAYDAIRAQYNGTIEV
jgi:hypothetical protein